MKTKQELKQYFKNGDIPNQEQFWAWQDSYWHKDDKIFIEHVEGLKTTLNNKLNKPSGTGFYFLSQNGDISNFQKIDIQSYYLLYWNGSNFAKSNIYYNNDKLGIGINTNLTEALEVNGNIKTNGLIITELPNEQGNSNFNKNIIAKADGTLAWEDKTLGRLPFYSPREQATGEKWIDNKPIYRTTVSFDRIPSNGEINLLKNFSDNIETIVSNQMFTKWLARDITFAGNQWQGQVFITVQPDIVKIKDVRTADYDYSLIDSFILTLEYTKKTD